MHFPREESGRRQRGGEGRRRLGRRPPGECQRGTEAVCRSRDEAGEAVTSEHRPAPCSPGEIPKGSVRKTRL